MKQQKKERLAKVSVWSLSKVGRIILVILVVVIFAWSYFKLTSVRSFPIKMVKVKGDYTHIAKSTLQHTIKPFVNVSFFALQASVLQHRLEQLPWVGNANIRRVFPATVVVAVNEKQPIAIWNKTTLMTADGKLFAPEKSSYPTNIPFLNGPVDEEKNLLATMQKMNKVLQPLNLIVQQLTLSPRRAWHLVLSNGIKVTIGQRDIWQRVQQMVTVFPKVVGSRGNAVESIDLRYPNGIAVQWKRS